MVDRPYYLVSTTVSIVLFPPVLARMTIVGNLGCDYLLGVGSEELLTDEQE